MSQYILIADDNTSISEILSKYVKKEGYNPIIANTGLEAIELFKSHNPILILLDIMMPLKDGIEVCKEIRQTSNVPIIMITAKGQDDDKISGLNFGADDYIVKPFSPREVIARINALLRRTNINNSKADSLIINNLEINIKEYYVKIDGKNFNLTKKEIEILWLFANNINKVFTRDNIIDSVWGYEFDGYTRTVDTNIKRLRKKLVIDSSYSWDIITIWGVGYKFEVKNV